MPPTKYGGPLNSTMGLVLHVNDGNGDPYNWWMNPAAPTASSHFQCMKDGTLIQYVGTDTVAYAQVAGNANWHSCETEGYPTEALSQAQVDKITKLYSWGIASLGWKAQVTNDINTPGFGIHSMGGQAWGGHACPGDLRANQRQTILDGATKQGDSVLTVMPLLTSGDATHGYYVGIARHALSSAGWWIDVNNNYDANLVNVIKQLQQAAINQRLPGLPGNFAVDGSIGEQTWPLVLRVGYGAKLVVPGH